MSASRAFEQGKSQVFASPVLRVFLAQLCSFACVVSGSLLFPGSTAFAQSFYMRTIQPGHPTSGGKDATVPSKIPAELAGSGGAREGKTSEADSRFVFEQGAIVRGDKTTKKLALVFTGDEFADGAEAITKTLKRRGVKASFFLTGRFYRNPNFKSAILRLKREGHFLGAHSDQHLLYCDWQERDKLLVSREKFEEDLNNNYAAMRAFGIAKNDARFFLPPFEWYNRKVSDWTAALGLQLINFTPGTRSNADYTTPEMKNYVSSEAILRRIKDYEAQDSAGLNGFILLMHVGVAPERTDKFYNRLDELVEWLKSKNYKFVRVDQLLSS